MAREPIRWDNVAPPQFNNSALAVASGAFSSTAADAAKLAETLRARELENRAKREQDALNQALGRLYSDGKATPGDLQNVPAGTNMTALTQAFRDLGTYNAGVAESGANVRASDARANWDTAQMQAYPTKLAQEADESKARLTTLDAQAGAAREQQGWTAEQRARDTEAHKKGVDLEKRLGTYLDWRFGDVEGGLLYQADQEFPQAVQEKAIEKAKELGMTPEEVIASTPPEEMAEIKRQHRLNYVARFMQSEDTPDQIYRATGLTPTEQAQLTKDGQNRDLDEAAVRQSQADLVAKRNEEAEQQTEWIKATQKKDFSKVLYSGPGQVSWGPANNIVKDKAEVLARTQYKLTDKDKVEMVRSVAPNMGAFENVLLQVTDPAGWSEGSTKRKFPKDEEFNARLKVISDEFLTASGAQLQGPDNIQSGTPVQNLRNSLGAAWSVLQGQGGESEQAQAAPVQEQVAALKEQIIAAKTDINSLVENLPGELKADRQVKTEIANVLEALSGKKKIQREPTASGSVASSIVAAREVPLGQEEIDQRLARWSEFEPILKERIKALQTSKEKKDALQAMFDELAQ